MVELALELETEYYIEFDIGLNGGSLGELKLAIKFSIGASKGTDVVLTGLLGAVSTVGT